MRIPRIRLWMLMLVVAVVGLAMSLVARRERLQRLADYHDRQSLLTMLDDDGREMPFETLEEVTELARRGYLAGGLGYEPGGATQPLTPTPMNWKTIFIVYLKELKDQLRDRRTIISTIVIPTVVMPLIMFGFGTVMTKIIRQAQDEGTSVMIVGSTGAPELVKAL